MLDRVTDRNARHWNGGDTTELARMMDDGRATRFAQWKSELTPRSHVLVKTLGDMINASWDVTNTGGVEGVGFIDILISSSGVGWTGNGQWVPPGSTRTLTLSGQVSTLTPGSYACQLRVRAVSPSTVAPGSVHDFTITIPPAGAVMQGLGIPVIT